MPLQKLQFRPGITRDITQLAAEGGWYACDKVRFRMGFPEKIGGWQRISNAIYRGLCRALASWRTLSGLTLTAVGTNLKTYVVTGGVYYDITPLASTAVIAANAFTTVNGSGVVTVNNVAHSAFTGDFVTVSAVSAAVGGITAVQLAGEFQITFVDADHYTIQTAGTASSNATGAGATFAYQIPVGSDTPSASYGWGTGAWGTGSWSFASGTQPARVWSLVTYGEDLIYGPSLGSLYYFAPGIGITSFNRGVLVSSLGGAASVPLMQNLMTFSPSARILIALGTNGYGSTTYDPLLVRWSDSESIVNWVPAATTQSGEYRLTSGSEIIASAHSRQDTLVFTDTALYLMQYVGVPYVFSFTQQSDNISIMSRNSAVSAADRVFWMGVDKFYLYDGRVQPLACPMRNEIFNNIDPARASQTFGGTNEGFNEVWWFYCSIGASIPDKYVIFNYVDNLWYYGSMTRTAWLDSPLNGGPLAATDVYNLVVHETGVDDQSGTAIAAITAYVESADFDIGDGENYAFIRKLLPDVNFAGSTGPTPSAYIMLKGRRNPGGNVTDLSPNIITLTASSPDLRWTDEIDVRLRARQVTIRMSSSEIGVKWQFGTPRIHVRPDGRAA
jgi:hypothetical protein